MSRLKNKDESKHPRHVRMSISCDARKLNQCIDKIDAEISNPDFDREMFIRSATTEFAELFTDFEKALPIYIESSTTTRANKVVVTLKPSERLYDFLAAVRAANRKAH